MTRTLALALQLSGAMSNKASVLIVLVMAGCGAVHDDGLQVDGGGEPDGGGDDGGEPDAPTDAPPMICAPNAALRCEDTTLISCDATGTQELHETCALRCNATALACENAVDPSNGFAAQLDAAAGEPDLVIAQNTFFSVTTDFDASTGTVKVGTQQVKATRVAGVNGAPDVVVLSVGSLAVNAGVKLTVFGDEPIAIASAADITIAGTLELANGFAKAGEPCFGGTSGATGADNDVPGGGGAGFGQQGANGGTVIGVGAGKLGGTTTGNVTLIPLRGGCTGGTDSLGGGGRGGGAGQLISASVIHVTGVIGANGTGGAVSAGGGSGGAVLLEARGVEITGGVFANGGAGGCGGFSSGANGQNSTTPAAGAVCGTVLGGNGGAGTTAPTQGSSVTNRASMVDRAGGGGGGVGRIRINTLSGSVDGNGAQSPPASVGAVAGR